MSFDACITLAVVLAMVVVLVLNRMPPFAAVIGAVVLLMFAGVISSEQAFQGFASSAAATVAAFYVVAFAIEKTGALRRPLGRVFDDGRRIRVSLARIAVPAGTASAFVNSTPIVAMLVEPIQAWTRRTGYPASKVLIALSYTTILGGATTLIGTSTNLVVSDLVRKTGHDAFGFFELAKVGLPVALAGIVVILLLAPLLLPNRGVS